MSRPERFQLRRVKGWRKPPDGVVVARPTPWGNPFSWQAPCEAYDCTQAQGRWDAANRFRLLLLGDAETLDAAEPNFRAVLRRTQVFILANLPLLRGRPLGCWCPLDQPCHADVLLERANG